MVEVGVGVGVEVGDAVTVNGAEHEDPDS